MNDIVIVDLGTGNLRSVQKAVEHIAPQRQVSISHTPNEIRQAGHLILPGQGAIGTWIKQLERDLALRAAVDARLQSGPVLGICLGLQALFERSEENQGTTCLGLLAGTVRHFDGLNAKAEAEAKQIGAEPGRLKVPHMGWNTVRQTRPHPLWQGIDHHERFYFVHSYLVVADNPTDIAGLTEYGVTFCSAAAKDNLFAVQFHPEKSQSAGLKLLTNFINWSGSL